MALLFASNDWETNETGEELCKNFIKDVKNPKKKNRKKKRLQTESKSVEEPISNFREPTKTKIMNKYKSDNSNLTLSNVNKNLVRKLKKKLKNSKDIFNEQSHKKVSSTATKQLNFKKSYEKDQEIPYGKSVKRKNEEAEMFDNNIESQPLLKKLKTVGNEKKKLKKNNTVIADSLELINEFGKKKCKKKRERISEESTKLLNNTESYTGEASNNKLKKKKHKNKKPLSLSAELKTNNFKLELEKINPNQLKKRKKQLEKLQSLILQNQPLSEPSISSKKPLLTLRQKMMQKLKAARFRFLNEQIYTTNSKEAEKVFRADPEAFRAYHEGYTQQVKRWPLNPLDSVIKSIKNMPKSYTIADFGCGEAKLAKSVKQTVHSFDLVAVDETVTACDMAHVPLKDSSVDVAVFCLSLMGTNLRDYFVEANRVLKNGGILKIAEVESRFEDINTFIKHCEQFGFKKTWMDLSHNLFYFIDLRKENNVKGKKKLPEVTLQPCLYKKR